MISRLFLGVGAVLFGAFLGLSDFGPIARANAASGRIVLQSGNVTRSALLVEHARLKKSRRPVVIILHGDGGSAVRSRHLLGIEEKMRSARPVLVYPDAEKGHWSDKPANENPDVTFIRDLIAKLLNEGIADYHHLYIVGGSSGGQLALKLICSGSGEFAGAVTYFSALPADMAATCKPAKPIPMMFIFGTEDPKVPYNGGMSSLSDSKGEVLSALATVDTFAKIAGCADNHTSYLYPDHDTRDKSRTYLDKWTGCKAAVDFLRVEGGGHYLPRLGAISIAARASETERVLDLGRRNKDVDSAGLIWDFLRRHGA